MGTVMITGHNSEFKYLIQRYIRRSGHRTLLVASESELLAAARQEEPTLIILEADTPQQIGWTMLRKLKGDPATCDVPVVVCSWLDEKAHSPERDGLVYLRKPILYADITSALIDSGVDVLAEGSADGAGRESRKDQGGGGPRR